MTNRTLSNLQQRIIAGLLGAAILVFSVLWNEWSFFVVFLLISGFSLYEFFHLLRKAGIHANSGFGTLGGIVFYISVFLIEKDMLTGKFLYLLPPLFFLLFLIELFKVQEKPLATIAYTLFGILYVAFPFSLIMVSGFSSGNYDPGLTLGILFLLWGNDVGGYIAGMTLGKHKLFERVSPKKTWEGTLGGMVLSMAAAVVFSFYVPALDLIRWVGLSLVIVIFGSLGDLVESLFKRSLSIKDSSHLIPGHGGFLDRFDGWLIAAPFVAAYLKFFVVF